MAREVNAVWNYVNALSYRCIQEHKTVHVIDQGKKFETKSGFLTGYDLQKYTAGFTAFSEINSGTIDAIAAEYATRRKQFKKAKLGFRSSYGSRKSLGWIPVKGSSIKYKDGCIKYAGYSYQLKDKSFELDGVKLGAGNFAQDATGRWYLNVTCKVDAAVSSGKKAVGLDLGLKDSATASNGLKLNTRRYRELKDELAKAQRAEPMTEGQVRHQMKQQVAKLIKLGHTRKAEKLKRKMTARAEKAPKQLKAKSRTKAIHRKIYNLRSDDLHKFSRKLVNDNAAIFVGGVSAKAMQKLFGISSADASWGRFKTMLEYKCDHAGIIYEEVNEAYTTQACSCCGSISSSSPRGRAGLVIREWSCASCGAKHDRDVNAAKNILAVGMHRLAGGKQEKDDCLGTAGIQVVNKQLEKLHKNITFSHLEASA